MPTNSRERHPVRTHFIRAAALAAAAATLAACSDTADVLVPPPPVNAPIMQRYVALGNSLTAGMQSGGINDSTQREAYPYLLAHAAATPYLYVSIPNGCAPPLVSFGGPPVNAPGACGVSLVPPFVNNVAVPNAYASDLVVQYSPTSVVALTSFMNGGRGQVRRALDANPTFVTIWEGNNEVLYPASTGKLTPLPGQSPGLIPSKTIIGYIAAATDTLKREGHALRGGVLIGVIDVVNAPRLFPGNALLDETGAPTAFLLGIDQFVGTTVTVLPNCIGTDVLISSIIVDQMHAGTYPPVIACAPTTLPGIPAQAMLGDLFVLSATEQAAIHQVTVDVNAYLSTRAQELGWAYLDPNPLLVAAKSSGAIPALPDFTTPESPWGPFISVDGVHPRKPTHVLIANTLAQLINQKYGTSIPVISLP